MVALVGENGAGKSTFVTVANARAAMRQAPLLRILDEPSASLDARAEEWLFRQCAGLSRTDGGVTVLVTHRLTTARRLISSSFLTTARSSRPEPTKR